MGKADATAATERMTASFMVIDYGISEFLVDTGGDANLMTRIHVLLIRPSVSFPGMPMTAKSENIHGVWAQSRESSQNVEIGR
jgi:hypothetical protein